MNNLEFVAYFGFIVSLMNLFIHMLEPYLSNFYPLTEKQFIIECKKRSIIVSWVLFLSSIVVWTLA